MNQESHTDSPKRESKSGSPAYPAGLLGPDCGCPVYYAVTRCQHGEYACNLCNVEHTANCPKTQVAPVQKLGDPSDPDGWLGPLPQEMAGPAYSVEDVGLPSPDAHAVAAQHDVALETRIADTIDTVIRGADTRRAAARHIIALVREHDARSQGRLTRGEAMDAIAAFVAEARPAASHEGPTVSDLTAERFGPTGGER